MGNQLLKNYEIQKDPYLESGHQELWKVYSANKLDEKDRISSYSAFVFKKRVLKGKNIPNPIKEEVFAILRKEPQNLMKFKHPSILNLSEPLVEHKKCLVFASEKITNSIQNLLKSNNLSEIHQSEIEFKLHLHEIIEGLLFLHNNVKMVHLNICPANIYITESNKWKLSGFNFTNKEPEIQLFKENDSVLKDFPALFCPNLDYSAPEIFDSNTKISFAADVFSLGMTILAILRKSEENDKKEADFSGSSISKHKEEISVFLNKLEGFAFFQKLPSNLKFLLSRMLNLNPISRPTIQEINNSQWLNDPLVQTLNYLDSLGQRDEAQQTGFFKGLMKIIMKFEPGILKKRILPKILEFITKDHCSSVILSIIQSLLEENNFFSNKEEFITIVWPAIKRLTVLKEISAQSLLLLVNGMSKMGDYLTNSELQSSLLPLFLKCYECGVPKLEVAILKNTEYLVKKVDFPLIKNRILPKLLKLCSDERHETRKNAIFALNKIYSIFDKTTVNDLIMPILEKTLKKSNNETELTFIVLNMYDGMAKIIGIEGITNKIIPQLIPALSEKSIGKEEFLKRYEILQNLIKKVYEEKMKEFEQISEQEQNEKKKIDKAMNEIDQISKEKPEIIKKNEDGIDDFDFLKLFDKNLQINEPSKNFQPISEQSLEEKKLDFPIEKKISFVSTPIKTENPMNINNLVINSLGNSIKKPEKNQISASIKKSHNPFEEMLANNENIGIDNLNSLNNQENGISLNNLNKIMNFNEINNNSNINIDPLMNFQNPLNNFTKIVPFNANSSINNIENFASKAIIEKNPEKCFDFVDILIKPKLEDKKPKPEDKNNPFEMFSTIKFNPEDKIEKNPKSLFENSFDLI